MLPLTTSGAPVSAETPAVVCQPRSFPIQSVNNSGEYICTSCFIASSAVLMSAFVGGGIGWAFSCLGVSSKTSFVAGVAGTAGSLLGMVGMVGMECVTCRSDAINADDINADDINADDINADDIEATGTLSSTASRGVDNLAFENDESKCEGLNKDKNA